MLAAATLLAYHVRQFRHAPEPAGLRGYLHEEPTLTKRVLIVAMADAYERNRAGRPQGALGVGGAEHAGGRGHLVDDSRYDRYRALRRRQRHSALRLRQPR